MAEGFLELVMDDVERMVGGILAQVDGITSERLEVVLLRKLEASYDTLSLEQLMQSRQALGHKDGEDNPCKFCQLMARKEIELNE